MAIEKIVSRQGGKRRADDLDITIGQNLRAFRFERGISQQDLAERIHVSFQQLQKYERGVNRLSASTLLRIAHILGKDLDDFFKDGEGREDRMRQDTPLKKELQEITTSYQNIQDPNIRKSVRQMLRALARNTAA